MKEVLFSKRSCWLGMPIRFTKYSVGKNVSGEYELEVEYGLISKRIEKIQIVKIQDFSFYRTFFGFFLGVTNIRVKSGDRSTPTLYIKKIRKGQEFCNQLETLVADVRKEQGVKYNEKNIY